MEQRPYSPAKAEQAPVPLDAKSEVIYYRVGVAAHLPAQWKAQGGVIDLTQDITPSGLHVSTLELALEDRSNLLQLLTKLHEDRRVILWVNALR